MHVARIEVSLPRRQASIKRGGWRETGRGGKGTWQKGQEFAGKS